MLKQTVVCDKHGCTQEWTTTNHWYSVIYENGSLSVYPFNRNAYESGEDERVQVFCGQKHALEYLSSILPTLHSVGITPLVYNELLHEGVPIEVYAYPEVVEKSVI